jgi:hypothetical protein
MDDNLDIDYNIDCPGIARRIGEPDGCSKVNAREDVGRFVDEMSREVKRSKREAEFEHCLVGEMVMLMNEGNLIRR